MPNETSAPSSASRQTASGALATAPAGDESAGGYGSSYLSHSVDETTFYLMSQFNALGIQASYVFYQGCGNVSVAKTSEKQLAKVLLPALELPSGQPSAKLGLRTLQLTYNDVYGAPIDVTYGGITGPTTGFDRYVVDSLDIQSSLRRNNAYKSNSDYVVFLASDADQPTSTLAQIYNNPSLDTTGISKTVALTFLVFN
jgi:hypothetical protein